MSEREAAVLRRLTWKFDHFVSWLYTYRLYGPRCPDYAEHCPGCEAWQEHDELFNDAEWRPLPHDKETEG